MGGYSKASCYYNVPIIGGQFSTLTIVTGSTMTVPVSVKFGLVTSANLSTVTSYAGTSTDNTSYTTSVSANKANTTYTINLSGLTKGAQYYFAFTAIGRNLNSDDVVRPTTGTLKSAKLT